MTGTLAAIIGLGAILAAVTLVWILSVRLRDASIADVCWGLGFVLLAWLYFVLSPGSTPRSWLVATLITLWGVRLSVHIFCRNHGKGEDPRYQAMRASHGPAFWWRSLFTVFWLQATLLWFVALPLLVAVRASQPATLIALDGLGVLGFAVGLAFEVVGDHQLERHSVVGHVCDGGSHAGRMAHCPEPGPHDAVAGARVGGDAARGQPHSVEAQLPCVHRSHAGVRPMVSARSEVSRCGTLA